MAKENYTILLVDDEPDILDFMGYNLKKEGYHIVTAQDGYEAISLAGEHKPQLVILDVMMPGMDGIETCEKLKEIPELSGTIIAFLTARNEDYSQLAGFGAGADDYIAKPIKPSLLISRVKALLRRYRPETGYKTIESSDGLRIDRERYVVWRNNEKVELPRKEFELLNLLVSRPQKVFTREEIFLKVWGSEVIVGERTIDVHIRKLREKIGDEHIQTVKGVGYKYNPNPQ
jgi:two-component system, OmpR family, alkaline phosphatase synthesis response regulator PhoP